MGVRQFHNIEIVVAVVGYSSKIRHERRKENITLPQPPNVEVSSIINFYIKSFICPPESSIMHRHF